MRRALIEISATAIGKLKTILRDNNASALQFSVSAGGCNGFSYVLEPLMTLVDVDKDDELVSKDGLDVYVCKKSIMYLIGTQIGWERTMMSEGPVFKNPNAITSCGCDKSFNT